MSLKYLSTAVSTGVIMAFITAGSAAAQVRADIAPAAAPQDFGIDIDTGEHPDEWIVTGYAGPGFGGDVEESNASIGGVVSYLKNRTYGGEVLANFTPEFAFAPTDVESSINSYMFNGIAALPLGDFGTVQPFVSAGIGMMTIDGDATIDDVDGPFEVEGSQVAGNLGFGVMSFRDAWGVRSGLRYFAGLGGADVVDQTEDVEFLKPGDVLADTSFWQFDIGVAYRW